MGEPETLTFGPSQRSPRARRGSTWRSRSRDALRVLFDTSYPRLVAELSVVAPDTAEDLVQEAFVRAYAAGPRFLRVDDPEEWLRTTATGLHRRRSRRPGTDLQPTQDHSVLLLSCCRGSPAARLPAPALPGSGSTVGGFQPTLSARSTGLPCSGHAIGNGSTVVRVVLRRAPTSKSATASEVHRMFSRHKSEMPTPETALPGRDETMPVPAQHFVNGASLVPPFPEGTEAAVFGLGCFWGA